MYPRFHATKRYDLLEIQIPANSTQNKFPIPDQPQLRSDQDADIIIQAIEVFSIVDAPLSPNNVPVSSVPQIVNTYLTLYVDGEESVYRIPLIQLHRIQGSMDGTGVTIGATFDLQRFKNIMVDWTKSYFLTPVAYGTPPGTFTSFSFLLGVHYMKLPPGVMGNINKVENQQFCAVLPKQSS